MRRLFIDLRFVHLPFNPAPYYLNHIFDLFFVQVFSFGDIMPFRKTAATACGRCVLGYEDGMTRKRRLLAVVFGLCRRQPLFYKLTRMGGNRIDAFILKVPPLFSF
jgi:hypothetical protein